MQRDAKIADLRRLERVNTKAHMHNCYALTVRKLNPLPIASPTHSQKDSNVAANGPSLAPLELTSLLLLGPEIMMHVLTKPFENPSSSMSPKKGASLACINLASHPSGAPALLIGPVL